MPNHSYISLPTNAYAASTGLLALGKSSVARVVLKNTGTNGTTLYVYKATMSQDSGTPIQFSRSNNPTNAPTANTANPSPMRVGDTTASSGTFTYDMSGTALVPSSGIGGFIPANAVVKQIDLQPTILTPGTSFGYTVIVPASLSNSVTSLLGTVTSVNAIITLFWWEE